MSAEFAACFDAAMISLRDIVKLPGTVISITNCANRIVFFSKESGGMLLVLRPFRKQFGVNLWHVAVFEPALFPVVGRN